MGRKKLTELEVDEVEMRGQKREIEGASKKLEDVVEQLVKKYSADLDDFMDHVKECIDERDKLSDFELENMSIRVPVYMYFAATGLEQLGIEYDSAKTSRTQAYSRWFTLADGTIQDKQAEADRETLTEQFLEIAFQRAYKQLKQKLEVCENLCQSLRKVIGKRTQDIAIARYDQQGIERSDRD